MAKKSKKPLGWQGQLILVILVICAVVFHPTSILLIVGMAPTWVAAYSDRTKERMRGITIGAMNLAGCTPFILQLWLTEHNIENSLRLLADPLTWVVMYTTAGIGYCMEWAIVGTVSVFMHERAQIRIKALEKKQQDLIERWGEEVSGRLPLDEHGFPISDKKEPEGTDSEEENT